MEETHKKFMKMAIALSRFGMEQGKGGPFGCVIVKDGIIVPTQWSDFSIYSPAEGIYSNVVDLAKWIKLQLNNGTFENHSIITTGTLAEMQKPQNIAMDLFKEYFNVKPHT